MNLLVFTLAVDAEHVTLAFGLRWLEALAERFEHIDVVTMTRGPHRLPANVTVWSVGRERGYPEWLRALRFYWLVGKILRQRRVDVVFTHMIPVFAVLFWPVARLAGLHNVLWYAHGATPRILKIATRLVDRIVSSTPEGFRLRSDKVVFIGQGIDDRIFFPMPRRPGGQFRIITVGRLAASKGIDVMIRALARVTTTDWRLIVAGEGASDEERAYGEAMRNLAGAEGVAERVNFVGRKDAADIAGLLQDADVFLNLSTTGSLDKAIVEAMASGCPVLSSNEAFRTIARDNGFEEAAIERTTAAVVDAMTSFSLLRAPMRQALANRQSAVALRDHTLQGLILRLDRVLVEEARGSR